MLPLTRPQTSPLIPLIPTAPERILFTKGILRSAARFIVLLAGLLFRFEASGGMRVAEAVHVHGLDADSRAVIPTVGGTDAVASIFFALAPFVECEVLATHIAFDACFRCSWLLTVAGCPVGPRSMFWIVAVDSRWTMDDDMDLVVVSKCVKRIDCDVKIDDGVWQEMRMSNAR